MEFNNHKSLVNYGFEGFVSIESLWEDNSIIPKVRGVYLIIDPNYRSPKFINPGVGGFFKGKDPNVGIEELQLNWVDNSQVVYIGKAGSLTGQATLHSRINQYLKFGQGKKIGHWGGRLIWQLQEHKKLLFCWKQTPQEEPRNLERELIESFKNDFGSRPFANLSN